jgi:hypothetical protein
VVALWALAGLELSLIVFSRELRSSLDRTILRHTNLTLRSYNLVATYRKQRKKH